MSSAAENAWTDSVVQAYKKDIDRTLLRENLSLSVEDRFRRAMAWQGSRTKCGAPGVRPWPFEHDRF